MCFWSQNIRFKSISSGLRNAMDYVLRFSRRCNIVLNPFHERKTVRIQLTHFHINLHMYLRVTKRAIESKSKFLAQPTEIILYNVAFAQINIVCRLLFVVKYRKRISFSSANDHRSSTTQYENRMTFDHTHLKKENL